jgi:hypothetical protein
MNPDLNGGAQRIAGFTEWAAKRGDPRATNFKAAMGAYFDVAFRDDAASIDELQTKVPSLELVEDSLQVKNGWVLIPEWYLGITSSKTLANILRAVVRLQYRE